MFVGPIDAVLSDYNNVPKCIIVTRITVEPPNKGHLGTRASVLSSEVSFIRRLAMC